MVGRIAKYAACIKTDDSFNGKGSPLNSNTNIPVAVTIFFLCSEIVTFFCPLAPRSTCLRVDRQIDSCYMSEGPQQHLWDQGWQSSQRAQMHLITTFSPTALTSASHIRLRKKEIGRLRYPCIFCLLQRIADKHNNIVQ